MNRIARSLLAAVAVALCIASCVQADVRMHKLFSSEMVLQRNTAVPVYGWADPCEAVSVKFGDQALSTTAGTDGKWMVKLAKMPASTAPQDMTISGKNTITLTNILVGDVWLCSGQSNMAWGLGLLDYPCSKASWSRRITNGDKVCAGCF